MQTMKKFYVRLLVLAFLAMSSTAQSQFLNPRDVFDELMLRTDTSSFTLSKNILKQKDGDYVFFTYDNNDEVCEVRLVPKTPSIAKNLRLLPSNDFFLTDTLLNIQNQFITFKLRFTNLTRSNFLSLRFAVNDPAEPLEVCEVKLLPLTQTRVLFEPANDELFIGEEKVFELQTSNPENIKSETDWIRGADIDYRVSLRNGQVLLHLQPKSLGRRSVQIRLSTIKPWLDENRQLVYELPEIARNFTVKVSRLGFLNVDNKELIFDEKTKLDGLELTIDNHRNLQMQKTYRIEAQEEKGGALIGELFTRNYLANDKVLCVFRPYNYHRMSSGYLYIKDNDEARFITNFNILPRPTIQTISILRNGNQWTNNLSVYPGETIDLRIEGQSLHRANFAFEDVLILKTDSTIASENVVEYRIQVPMGITKKQIAIYSNKENTGYSLKVQEFQKPRDFDFIVMDYGGTGRKLVNFKRTEMYSETIKDLVITFQPDKIDGNNDLYGKQYVDIDVKLIGPNNELIEFTTISNLVIVPGNNSPRALYYDRRDVNANDVFLNQYLGRKTFDLAGWSKIQLTFRHQKDKYNGGGQSKTIEIILQRSMKFDIDMSFPAGLFTTLQQKAGSTTSLNSFNGISMAMIAQLSFYDKDKINRFKPYKIGAGFIAMNLFDFSGREEVVRDLSFVILGSLYPTRKDAKLTFPLYFGAGYMLTDTKDRFKNRLFLLIGPGIRVNF